MNPPGKLSLLSNQDLLEAHPAGVMGCTAPASNPRSSFISTGADGQGFPPDIPPKLDPAAPYIPLISPRCSMSHPGNQSAVSLPILDGQIASCVRSLRRGAIYLSHMPGHGVREAPGVGSTLPGSLSTAAAARPSSQSGGSISLSSKVGHLICPYTECERFDVHNCYYRPTCWRGDLYSLLHIVKRRFVRRLGT